MQKMKKIKQYSSFRLLKDINPTIKKDMIGVILEVYGSSKDYEVEFVKNDGSNYEFNGEITFTVNESYIEIIKPWKTKRRITNRSTE